MARTYNEVCRCLQPAACVPGDRWCAEARSTTAFAARMRRFIGCRAIHGPSSVSCVLPASALLAAVAGAWTALAAGAVAVSALAATGPWARRVDVPIRRFPALHRATQPGIVLSRTQPGAA